MTISRARSREVVIYQDIDTDDSVFAVELRQGGKVVRLAHTHSVYDDRQERDYWVQPHASVNRDFTRIVFTSNWGCSGTDQVEM